MTPTPATPPSATSGIDFPTAADQAGSRPTTPTVQGIVADAARVVAPDLAERVKGSTSWRQSYVEAIRHLTTASATTTDAPVDIARAGLASAYVRLVQVNADGREAPLADWDVDADVAAARGTLGTRVCSGTHQPVTELAIPYQGNELTGDALRHQLTEWVRHGIVEESCAQAITRVLEHPEWLSLPGRVVADIGAGAEMGPLEMLSRWGATILAIDIPRITPRLERIAESGAGEVRVPVEPSGAEGADIVADTAAVAAWIEEQAGSADIVLGMHAYADSGMHIKLTLAADVIGEYLRRVHPSTVLAYLATPTDAFVVPDEIVAGARRRWEAHGRRGVAKRALRLASRGQLFHEPYPNGSQVADCIVAQQGPNYAVAKRLQRWRAVVAEADGARVSFNVAPATLTRSVTKNPVLRAVYGGAHHFGVEVFDPATSRALMAALLVHDVMRESVPSEHPTTPRHPEELFSEAAAHGGLWRTAWSPRSALGVAAVLGAPRLIKRKG